MTAWRSNQGVAWRARRRGPGRSARATPRSAARFALPAWLAAAALTLGSCAAQPPCNPFYPTPRGASWTYRDAQRSSNAPLLRTVAVRSVETDGRLTTAVLQQSVTAPTGPGHPSGAATTTVRCAGGAVQLEVEGTAAAGGGASAVGTVKATLPGLPASEKLVPGYTWRSEGRVEATEGGAKLVTAVARSSRVEGLSPLQIGAGEFPQALQITSLETLRLATPAGERTAEQEVREWYVRGLGLVKRDTRIAGATPAVASSEELVGYSGLKPEP